MQQPPVPEDLEEEGDAEEQQEEAAEVEHLNSEEGLATSAATVMSINSSSLNSDGDMADPKGFEGNETGEGSKDPEEEGFEAEQQEETESNREASDSSTHRDSESVEKARKKRARLVYLTDGTVWGYDTDTSEAESNERYTLRRQQGLEE